MTTTEKETIRCDLTPFEAANGEAITIADICTLMFAAYKCGRDAALEVIQPEAINYAEVEQTGLRLLGKTIDNSCSEADDPVGAGLRLFRDAWEESRDER